MLNIIYQKNKHTRIAVIKRPTERALIRLDENRQIFGTKASHMATTVTDGVGVATCSLAPAALAMDLTGDTACCKAKHESSIFHY